MPDVGKLLSNMRSGKYTAKELQNLLSNANKNIQITDEEREDLVEGVEFALREYHPRAARKLLGPVSSRPIEFLEEIYANVKDNYDLTANRVKNGVKAGGSMRSGEAVLDWHISYKDGDAKGVVVGAYQWSANDPLKFKVFKYRQANKPGSTYDEKVYLEESPDILEEYKRILAELLPENGQRQQPES